MVDTEAIKKIFTRHIAKALGIMDASQCNDPLKRAVKAEFWYAAEDIIDHVNGREETEANGNRKTLNSK